MKFLSSKDNLSELEADVRNKFRWEWLEEKDFAEQKISQWCRKLNVSGCCFCTLCNSNIRYGSGGFKALFNHSKSNCHQSAFKAVKNSQYLHPPSSSTDDMTRTVDLASRRCRVDALLTSFIAENSLPFTLAPKLLELSKALSEDKTALNSSQMSRTTASYKLKYGLSKTVKEEQYLTLKNSFFSLNIDEAKNSAHDSILTVLVQYYCETDEKVTLRHLASLKLKSCTADSIYSSIVALMEENQLPWDKLISILMDSCNTMRGAKNGVEIQIKTKKAEHLLNIDGDICHTINNSAKKFTAPFLKHLEILCDNVYFDLKSSDKREIFFELCDVIDLKPLKPLSRPDHRWLFVLVVLDRLEYLWDALILFYFSWVNENDKELYIEDINSVIDKRKLNTTQQQKVKIIQQKLKKKTLTADGKNRKERIIQRIFIEKQKTSMHLNVYKTVLPHFNQFIKLLQTKSTLLHLMHFKLFTLTKQFLTFFLRHEVISSVANAKELVKVNLDDASVYLPEKLFAGTNNSTSPQAKKFRESLKTAYIKCGQYMIKKLPLTNSILTKFSGLDPNLRGLTETYIALSSLGKSVTNVISNDEFSQFDKEIRKYQIDTYLTNITEEKSVGEFWKAVFKKKEDALPEYPLLTKMVKAALTCFHGPHVEGAFSMMGNVMSEGRTSLNNEGLDSIQTMKYFLLSKNVSSTEYFKSNCPMNEALEQNFLHNLQKSRHLYSESLNASSSCNKEAKEDDTIGNVESEVQCNNNKRKPSSSATDMPAKKNKQGDEQQELNESIALPSSNVVIRAKNCAAKKQMTIHNFFK